VTVCRERSKDGTKSRANNKDASPCKERSKNKGRVYEVYRQSKYEKAKML